jgi:hypothetical protein
VAHADTLDVWADHPWATAAAAGLVCVVSLRETGLSGRSKLLGVTARSEP